MVFRKEDKFPEFEDPRAFDKEDCLSCRVLGIALHKFPFPLSLQRANSFSLAGKGSTAFVALGGYTYFSGMQQLRARQKAIELSKSKYKYGSRQLGILSLSATLVGLGIYRMFI
ncbi:hypothetical protein AYL99_01577 [Fonsecaea erecta]|uniref:DUF4536 domain-containing protein n=1 Tax=Fonsecaea erecta TaxID=1367422 RepID=A0A179A381_9EURO|nr:hypothetical protein AYL99_01577 [Fonsecaea erecta]OAP65605.1 hypothetical protein AYL99_01577 [Fonsecaea erecta]